MTKKTVIYFLLIAFFVGAIGSVFLNRFLIPNLSTVRGLSWLTAFSYNSPIVITRREEVRLNEGVNLIELTKQAQTVVVSIYSSANQKLLGNGIVITSDGTIFTTTEVLGSVTQVIVVTNDGTAYQGLVRAMDPKSPIAVVSVAARDLQVAQFSDASNMQIAQRIFALGKTNQEFTREFATGMVTKNLNNFLDPAQIFTTESFGRTISTDAQLSADYLGGPVVNLQGLVIGMVVGPNGLILPAEAIDGAINTYLANGKISRPYIGLNYQMITTSLSHVRNLPDSGALVVSTEAGSPAAKSGLVANDLITDLNGQKIGNASLEQFVLPAGSNPMRLTVLRGGSKVELTLQPELR
jgi:S1-C subfamily serine protease